MNKKPRELLIPLCCKATTHIYGKRVSDLVYLTEDALIFNKILNGVQQGKSISEATKKLNIIEQGDIYDTYSKYIGMAGLLVDGMVVDAIGGSPYIINNKIYELSKLMYFQDVFKVMGFVDENEYPVRPVTRKYNIEYQEYAIDLVNKYYDILLKEKCFSTFLSGTTLRKTSVLLAMCTPELLNQVTKVNKHTLMRDMIYDFAYLQSSAYLEPHVTLWSVVSNNIELGNILCSSTLNDDDVLVFSKFIANILLKIEKTIVHLEQLQQRNNNNV